MSTTDITSAVTLTARERQFLTGILLAEKPTDAEIVHVGEHGDTVAWRALLEKSPCGGAGVMGFVFTSSLPSQSLQRRARSRQVDVSAPRPVGTTTPGGAS